MKFVGTYGIFCVRCIFSVGKSTHNKDSSSPYKFSLRETERLRFAYRHGGIMPNEQNVAFRNNKRTYYRPHNREWQYLIPLHCVRGAGFRNRNLPILRGLAWRDDGQRFAPDSKSKPWSRPILTSTIKRRSTARADLLFMAPATGIEPVTNP